MANILQIVGLVGLVVGAFLLWGVGVAVLLAGVSSVAVGVALERQRANRATFSEAVEHAAAELRRIA